MVVDGHVSNLNRSAGAVFRQASQDPKAAVELFAKSHKMVNFDRKERPESEFRDWEDQQKDTFRDPRFLEGLMTQLRWLALSCEAAEADELKDVFPALLAYVDGLSRLTELPGPQLLQGVDNSIFAEAYQLRELLSKNESWEMVPINIGGIYDKTILPHLRAEEPESLIGAWDRRIAQETQMVAFFSNLEEQGNNRDDRRAAGNQARQLQQGRGGNLVRAYDEYDFRMNTLPTLQWRRYRDMALHVDAVQGVAGMLAQVKANTEHPKVSDWLDDLAQVVEQVSGSPGGTPAPASSPPAVARPAVPSSPLPGSPGTTGAVPPGLE